MITDEDILRQMAQEQTVAKPTFARLLESVRRKVARLDDGRALDNEDVQRAVAAVDVPVLTAGLIELAAQHVGVTPLERLVLALVLYKALAGTLMGQFWKPAFAKRASDAIYDTGVLPLLSLRLELLDELLTTESPILNQAELHLQRGNVLKALGRPQREAIAQWRKAVLLAEAANDGDRLAEATAALVTALAIPEPGSTPSDGELARAQQLVERALAMESKASVRVLVLQAQARVLGRTEPLRAREVLQTAMTLVQPEDPFWTKLAGQCVCMVLDTASCPADIHQAALQGIEWLDQSRCEPNGLEVGQLQVMVGVALRWSRKLHEARQYLEAGLASVRGRDFGNEAIAHVQLAHVSIFWGDDARLDEHVCWLQQRRDALDSISRRELAELETLSSDTRREVAQWWEHQQQRVVMKQGAAEQRRDVEASARLLKHPAGEAFWGVRVHMMAPSEIAPPARRATPIDSQQPTAGGASQLMAAMAWSACGARFTCRGQGVGSYQ